MCWCDSDDSWIDPSHRSTGVRGGTNAGNFSFYLISSSSVVDADEFARFAVVWRKRCSGTGPVRANQPCPRLALRQPIGRSNPSGLAAHSKTKSTFLIAVVSFTCLTLSIIYSRQLQRFRIARHRNRRVFIHLFIYLGEPLSYLSPNAILGCIKSVYKVFNTP